MKKRLDDLKNDLLLSGASEESESLVAMGVNDLSKDDPESALERFDTALEKTHQVPAAWLGKAYAEVYVSDELDEVLSSLESSILNAIEHANTDRDFGEIIECCTQDPEELAPVEELILLSYLALLNILIQRNTSIVRERIRKAVSAEVKAEGAQKAANISAFLAGAGVGVAATSDTWKGKAAGAGGALLAGTATAELEMDADDLSVLQESAWGEAIARCIGMLPFDKSAGGLKNLLLQPSDEAREEVSRTLTEWRITVKEVFEKRLDALREEVDNKQSTFRRDSKVSTVLENEGLAGIEEFSDLHRKLKEVISLLEPAAWSYYRGPERFKELETVKAVAGLNETLKRAGSAEAKENHTKTKRIKLAIYWSPLLVALALPQLVGYILIAGLVAGYSTYFFYHSDIQEDILSNMKTLSEKSEKFELKIRNDVQDDISESMKNNTKATF